MRKIILSILMLLIIPDSFSQQTTTTEYPLTSADYIKKSNNQRTAGTILLTGGLALFATGTILPGMKSNKCSDLLCLEDLGKEAVKATLQGAGSLAALGSIPFFVLSANNRRNAATVELTTQKTVHLSKGNLVYNTFPAVGIKIIF